MKLIDRIRVGVRDDVGPAVRRARTDAGYSLDALARAVGVSNTLLVNVESATTKPSVELLVAIAHVLDTTLDALVPVSVTVED